MRMVEDQTKVGETSCISFIENTDNSEDYLSITSDKGCYSQIGKTGGAQVLSLETQDSDGRSCMYPNIVAHESLHALGLFYFI